MKILSIINNKGGVGKTTTTLNLASALGRKGLRVGVIDFDSQANLTSTYNFEAQNNLREVLESRLPAKAEDFCQTGTKNVYLLPNNKNTTSKLFWGFDDIERLFVLQNALKNDLFDWVLIDTPPNLDVQTYNAIVASDYILIPVEYDVYSIEGLGEIFENVEKIKEKINPKIEVLGIVITQVDQRASINNPINEKLQRDYGKYILKSSIRTNAQYRNSQALKQDIFAFGDLKGIEDYNNLTNEILQLAK